MDVTFLACNTFLLREGITSPRTLLKFWKLCPADVFKNVQELGFTDVIRRDQWRNHIRSIEQTNEFSLALIQSLRSITYWLADAVTQYTFIKERKINVIDYWSKEYPETLRAIADPPLLLYVKGNLDILNRICRGVALVGTRRPSLQGVAYTRLFVKQVVSANVPTVSGFAKGIDWAVWRFTQEINGTTIAVLPFLSDAIASPMYKIPDNCMIISEYPCYPKIFHPWYFIERNRLIAGSTQATVAIEAPLGSGALHTAKFAADYGRFVGIVPHELGNILAKGQLYYAAREDQRFIISMKDVFEATGDKEALTQWGKLLILEIYKAGEDIVPVKEWQYAAIEGVLLKRLIYGADIRGILYRLCAKNIEWLTALVIELKQRGLLEQRNERLFINFLHS